MTGLARGQVWRVQLATKTRAVVVVESNAALDALPGTAVCMMIDETLGAPDTVVTIPMTHPVRGAAVSVDLTALTDKRLQAGELLGVVDAATMERISAALRVTLDLT
ncbi:type II toxin-antitoxin system PemK/MazF family toxin [Streptacidiphilus melanogenes]|uniref:type II toxin-antitoxin system PemK/MazF family toxin n=1 Tax=Streptacidiphilus melanogenes TaxID=411235 RepID=UPI000A883E03|nr:type II toxin-antitoxin system PemK/MazF family toxin [Streptacidiphilus melanogenes]